MELLNKKRTLTELRAVKSLLHSNTDILLLGKALEERPTNEKQLKRSVSSWIEDTKTKQKTKDQIIFLYDKINNILENRLIENGLTNKLNSSLVTFTLKNLHNWKDKQELETRNINIELDQTFNEIIEDQQPIIKTETIPYLYEPPPAKTIERPQAAKTHPLPIKKKKYSSKKPTHTGKWTPRRML